MPFRSAFRIFFKRLELRYYFIRIEGGTGEHMHKTGDIAKADGVYAAGSLRDLVFFQTVPQGITRQAQ